MRARLRFAKHGKVRFTSHRDVARMWERAFRRAGLPLAYTGGFSPRPRVSFGLALPTGYESDAEYLDVDLAAPVDTEALPELLTPLLPEGVEATAAVVADERAPSLQQDVTTCTWLLELQGVDPAALPQRIAEVLALPELIATRTRKGAPVTDDLRPAIVALAPAGHAPEGGRVLVEAELGTQPRALRPSELVEAAWPGVELVRATRTHQWIERDGARWEPIELPHGATAAPHAGRRAS